MNEKKSAKNVSRDVSRNDKIFQNAMLNAVGMRKTTAWVPAEKTDQKSKIRKRKYRQKIAVSGIRQLNVEVPDSEHTRKTFKKLAKAVSNDEIRMDRLALLIEDPEKADMAVQIITAIQARTIRGRLLNAVLKFMTRSKISLRTIPNNTTKEYAA